MLLPIVTVLLLFIPVLRSETHFFNHMHRVRCTNSYIMAMFYLIAVIKMLFWIIKGNKIHLGHVQAKEINPK